MQQLRNFVILSSLIAAGGVLLNTRLVSPLTKVSWTTQIPIEPDKLETYLEQSEKKIGPKIGTEKRIFFPSSKQQKEKLSFIYLHGFSASRREVSPVMEKVALHWNAPIFMTRYAGHGLNADALGAASKEEWLQDTLEAYQIGRSLGDEIIVTCLSTGCALALYLAYFYPEHIRALIMLSPNFSPADRRAFLALGPLGPTITRIVVGEYREFKPANPEQAYFWTTRYRYPVIPEMISLVNGVTHLDLEKIKTPTLTIYTPHDNVISPLAIEKNIPRLACPKNKIVALAQTREHILGGNIMDPNMNDFLIHTINDFIEKL